MRPTRVDVDLDAIAGNARRIRQLAGDGELCAVIKADAYGHGAVAVARALRSEGVAWLAVALVEEAQALRQAGILGPLLVLGADYRDAFDAIVSHRLTPMVGQRREIDGLSRAAVARGTSIDVHVELDTGMRRLGVAVEEAVALAEYIEHSEGVTLSGLMTHYSHADVLDGEISRQQGELFERAWQTLQPKTPTLKHRHIVSSGALSSATLGPQQVLRCGLAVYGIEPVPHAPIGGLTPALRWSTRPIAVRDVPQGATVSYRGRWRAARPSRIATLPLGYADGYPRLVSHRAQVLVRGQRAPVVGAICMDLTMVDVTDIEHEAAPISFDDEMVLLGAQGEGHIGADELGTWAETIPYEIIAGIGPRVPRHYRGRHAT